MLNSKKMQKNKFDEEPSYFDKEAWDDWASRSSVSLQDELSPPSPGAPLSLMAERDALARALSLERQRAAAAARAHDARLAELHGVIAELVRRARGREGRAIPEEELSDECESTTQPAGELDHDTEQSRTEQNDTSSLSPDPAPPERELKEADDVTDTHEEDRVNPALLVAGASGSEAGDSNVSEQESKCREARSPASCLRERGSPDGKLYTSPGGVSSRVAKLASRVRLKTRNEDCDSSIISSDELLPRSALTAERVAAAVCAQAALREKIAGIQHDGAAVAASASLCRARAEHLAAENITLRHALTAATHTQHRLWRCLSAQESSCVCVCASLAAADRAIETYDVLLALAETRDTSQRAEAELVASELLSRLEAAPVLGAPLLSPGPWAQKLSGSPAPWSPAAEARLRAHAARLKADTVRLRGLAPPPKLYTHYDSEEQDADSPAPLNMAALEDAVALEELTLVRESRAAARVAALLQDDTETHVQPQSDSAKARRRRHTQDRGWMHAPSETQL